MPDVEIAGSNTILSFPDTMSDAQIKSVLDNHPEVRAMRRKLRPKSRVDLHVEQTTRELGITPEQARTQGISPAVQQAGRAAEQRDVARIQELSRQQEQAYRGAVGESQARAVEKKYRPKTKDAARPAAAKEAATRKELSTLVQRQHQRTGTEQSTNLFRQAMPGYSAARAEQKGVHAGLTDVAEGMFNLENLGIMGATGSVLRSLGLNAPQAIRRVGLLMGGAGVADSARDVETLKKDPGRYWARIGANALMMGPDIHASNKARVQAKKAAVEAAQPRRTVEKGKIKDYNALVGEVEYARQKTTKATAVKVGGKRKGEIRRSVEPGTGRLPAEPDGAGILQPDAQVLPSARRDSPKSATREVMRPEEIEVLPGMQYKKQGVTDPVNAVGDTLKGTDVYDVDQGGTWTVWERADGKKFVVNGHHRRELANRADTFVKIGPDGQPVEVPREIPVNVLREEDGWTLERARARGALENIRDNKGSALDALEVIRGLGVPPEQFGRHGISTTSDLARNIAGLQDLDPQALTRVQMGDVTEQVAAGIGSIKGLSPEAQRGAMDDAASSGLGTYQKARRLAEKYLQDEQRGLLAQQTEGDLFGGEFNISTSTRGIQVKIEDAATRLLKAERSDLLSPTGAKLREGENIDVAARRAEAQGMAESPRALDERLGLLYRQESVQEAVANLAAEVGNGRLSERDAANTLAGLLRPHTGRSVADLADAGRIRLDSGRSDAGTLATRDAAIPEPVPALGLREGETGLFADAAPERPRGLPSTVADRPGGDTVPPPSVPSVEVAPSQPTVTLSFARTTLNELSNQADQILGRGNPLTAAIDAKLDSATGKKPIAFQFTPEQAQSFRQLVEQTTQAPGYNKRLLLEKIDSALAPPALPAPPSVNTKELPAYSGLEPTATHFNTPASRLEDYGWRSMGESEYQKLVTGQHTYKPNDTGKGNYIAPTPQSGAQYAGKGKYLVEFKGVGDTSLETISNPVGRDNISAVWKYDGKEWIRQPLTHSAPPSQNSSPRPSAQLNMGVDPALIGEAARAVKAKVQGIRPNKKQAAALQRQQNPDAKYRPQPFRSPLTIKNAFGEEISLTGGIETRANKFGSPEAQAAATKVNDAGLLADRTIEDRAHATQKAVDEIESLLQADETYKSLPKEARDKSFVALVERDRSDPLRMAAKGKLKEALDRHDALTEEWRQYIIKTRREAGVDTPDDWGITEKGYYRHLFMGDIRLYEITPSGRKELTSERGFYRNYAEAQARVNQELKQNPNAKFEAQARDITAGDSALRTEKGRYFGIVSDVAKGIEAREGVKIDHADIMADLTGKLGLKQKKNKFNPVTLMRKGYQGYDLDYGRVMRITGGQVARAQELTLLQRKVQPEIETLKKQGMNGLAEDVQYWLDDLWGTPTRSEQIAGMGLRSAARRIAHTNNLLKLHFNPGAATANALDPLATLWPRVSTKEFVGLYAEYAKPSTRARLREAGVLQGASKLDDTGALVRGKATGIDRVNLFRKASDMNRGIGYLYGEHEARLRDVSDPATLHENGMAWAKVVEYASNQFHRAPVLRGPIASVFLQYKGYSLKQYETMLNMLREQPGDVILQTGKKNINLTKGARLSKFAAGKVAIGGGKALGLASMPIVAGLTALLIKAGMEKRDAEKWANYGLAGQIGEGVDFSGKIGSFELPYGQNAEQKAVNLFTGPTGGAIANIVNSAMKPGKNPKQRKARRESWMKTAERIAPVVKQVRTGVEMAQRGGTVREKAGRKNLTLNPMESVGQALGFPPVRKSQQYDRR